MINTIINYFRPANTASVLTKITSMIDALDKVNEQHSALGMKHSEAAQAYRAKAEAALNEAAIANTATKKIKAAFGV